MTRPRCRRAGERGQAFAELALTLGLLLLILGGIVEFSNVNVQLYNISDSARDGAIYAAGNPTAWSSAGTPAAGSVEWAIQLEAVAAGLQIGNTWSDYVSQTAPSPPASEPNPPRSGSTGIAVTYICGPNTTCTPAGAECGYYSPQYGFEVHSGSTYTQAICTAPGNLVKVGVRYTIAPITNLLHGIAPVGFAVAYATTMPIT